MLSGADDRFASSARSSGWAGFICMTEIYWLEQSEADVPPGDEWLHRAEITRLSSMRFPKRRTEWRLGRWTAKRAVASYLGLQPVWLPDLQIRAADSGAPEVFILDKQAAIHISISHRGGRAVCALATDNAALGCDLELVEPRSQAFAADYFTAEEQALVAEADAPDRFRILALLWSAKESALKALGEGLRLDTFSVAVSIADGLSHLKDTGGRWHPLHVRYTGGEIFRGWWQQTGNLLRTVAAAPPPAVPILLNAAFA